MPLGSKYNADGYSSGVLDDILDDRPIPLGAPRRKKSRRKIRRASPRTGRAHKPTKRARRRNKRKYAPHRKRVRKKRVKSPRRAGRKLVQFRDKKTGRMIKFYAKR